MRPASVICLSPVATCRVLRRRRWRERSTLSLPLFSVSLKPWSPVSPALPDMLVHSAIVKIDPPKSKRMSIPLVGIGVAALCLRPNRPWISAQLKGAAEEPVECDRKQ